MQVIPYTQEGILFIRFDTEFSIRNLTDVEAIWDEARKNHTKLVAFEFVSLEFIDSSAIGTLVKYLNEGTPEGIEIFILDASPAINKIFTTAHLTKLFRIMSRAEFEDKYLSRR